MRLVQAVVCTWVWRTLYHQRAYKNKCMCKACCWTQSCGVWITKMLCSVSGIMRMLLHDSFYVRRGDRRHSDILLERKTWNDKDIVREAVVKQPVRAGKRTIYSTSYSNYSMVVCWKWSHTFIQAKRWRSHNFSSQSKLSRENVGGIICIIMLSKIQPICKGAWSWKGWTLNVINSDKKWVIKVNECVTFKPKETMSKSLKDEWNRTWVL